MKKQLLLVVFIIYSLSASAQFEHFFTDSSLRIDYYHYGNADSEYYALKEMIREPYWSGSHNHLIDSTNYGDYYVSVMLFDSDVTLFSRGYNTLFGEWQTTAEARETSKGFEETVVLPFPKEKIDVVLFSRNWEGEFVEKFRVTVNPSDYFIRPAKKLNYPIYEAWIGDTCHSKTVDIVILPDGYTEAEMGKFVKDCQFFVNSLFAYSPYDALKHKFNIRAIMAPSVESGCTMPGEGIYVNTIMDFSFWTFDSERYCMSTNNKAIRDLAGQVPYDQIYVLMNTPKYGGGGIYNFYCSSASGNSLSSDIIVHEFGHGFAGLADEYYDDSDAYDNFYNLEIEPWEPNISTMVNFDSKWKNMMNKKTPIPTPQNEKYNNTLGVFEGGGYVAKGMYRPRIDCLMKTFKGDTFCEVCKKSIEKMIRFYSE